MANDLLRPDRKCLGSSRALPRAGPSRYSSGKVSAKSSNSAADKDATRYCSLQNGFEVCAVDYSEKGLELRDKAERLGVGRFIQTMRHDVRRPLPFKANTFDARFSHMLYCMALTTAELETLSEETRRVLKPGGLNLYAVRNTHDPDYGAGVHWGEDMYEDEGFIVHYFSRDKVERLALGYQLLDIEEFEQSKLPKRLYLVTLRKPENNSTERSAV